MIHSEHSSLIKLARTPLFVAVLIAAAIYTLPVVAQDNNTNQPSSPQQPTQLEKVQVTGSLIPSSDKVGYNQVQTITGAEIKASGATTIDELLRDTAVDSANSWGSNFDYGATGGSGIALRGLSEKYTLVLVDGQRVAPFAFPSNGTDSFVDLNSIPINMVERIEIVKTGAVSEYGSDAIGGVVNIITKKQYQGLEVSGGLGNATQGGAATKRFSVLGGFGDLDRDRYNVTFGADYFHQNGFTLADRSNTAGQNYSNRPFGVDGQGASYWEPGGVGNPGAALSSCPYGGQTVAASHLLNGPSSGQACAASTANGYTVLPDQERSNVKIHATFKLDDHTQAFADFWGSRTVTTIRQGYNTINDGSEAYDPVNGGLNQVSNVVLASNPYNPYNANTPLTYAFLQQAQQTRAVSNFFRLSTGLNGVLDTSALGDWDWSASVSHSQDRVSNTVTGLLNVATVQNLINNGGLNFADPSATPSGLDGLYGRDQNQAISKLDTLDLTAYNDSLYGLPAGNIGLGLGAQFRHESDLIQEYPNQADGLLIPFNLQSVDGQRNVAAAYYQLEVPITSQLSFSQSGRYDHYSDFGRAFSPRFALRFQPVSWLTAYASYSRGFRAPTLAENSQSTTSGIQEAIDPYSPTYNPANPQSVTYAVLTRGNPDLKPERTQNYNAGFELSPDANTGVGLDWYKIVVNNAIGTGNMQTLVDANNPSVVIRNANGTIAYVNIDYENLNRVSTDGFELTFNRSQATSIGTFSLSGDAAYVWHFTQESGGESVDFAGNDGALNTPYGASFPRWKGNLALGWGYGDIHSTLSYQYIGPYRLVLESAPGHVSSYSQFNLNVSYTGFKRWTLYATVKNLLDRAPPFDPIWLAYPTATPYDPSLYNDEGRYVEVGATYRFF
jgi:iron complex outermembrane receptor protein